MCGEGTNDWWFLGPSITTLLGSATRVFAFSWMIGEDDSVLLDNIKAKELISGIIPPMDVLL